MAIARGRAGDRNQACVDGRLKNLDGDPPANLLAYGIKHVAEGWVLVKGDQQQRALRKPRKLTGLWGERPLEPIGQRNTSECALAPIGALQPQRAWQLEQRQWVAQSLVQNQPAGLNVHVWCDAYQQLSRRLVAQRFDIDLRQLLGSERGLEGLSQADEDEDAGRLEPASDKAQDGGGRTVLPLKVVRNHDQRPFACDRVEEA